MVVDIALSAHPSDTLSSIHGITVTIDLTRYAGVPAVDTEWLRVRTPGIICGVTDRTDAILALAQELNFNSVEPRLPTPAESTKMKTISPAVWS